MAVAATFMTVSAFRPFAQSTRRRATTADLAIDAAVPMPEPANVPPPTASDFKTETTGAVPHGQAKRRVKPAVRMRHRRAEAHRDRRCARRRTPPSRRHPPRRRNLRQAATRREAAKPATAVAAADQPVAERLRDMMSAPRPSRYFDRKGERAAVEKFYAARDYAPLWTPVRHADRARQVRRSPVSTAPPPMA